MHRNIAKTFFEDSFGFKKSCVTGHISEIPQDSGRTCIVNDFIAFFPAMYGTFVTGGGLDGAVGRYGNGKVTIRMTPSAKKFWNGPVWEEWLVAFPDLKHFLEWYPKDKVDIVEVLVIGYNSKK